MQRLSVRRSETDMVVVGAALHYLWTDTTFDTTSAGLAVGDWSVNWGSATVSLGLNAETAEEARSAAAWFEGRIH